MKMDNSRRFYPDNYNEMQADTHKAPNAVLSVVLCVLAVFLMFIFIVLMVVRSLGVGHIIRHTDIMEIIEVSTVGFHPEDIVDQINELPFSDFEVSIRDIEEFIKHEAVTGELESILDAYAMAFILGNLDHHLTADDIVDIARTLEPEIHEFFDHRLTEEDFDVLAVTLDDIVDFSSLSIDVIMEEVDVDLTVPFILISPALIWVVGILSAALLVIIFLRRRRNPADASLAVGIPVLVTGIIAIIAGFLIRASTADLGGAFLDFPGLIEAPAQSMSQYGFVFAGVGAAIIVIAYIFMSIAPRKFR